MRSEYLRKLIDKIDVEGEKAYREQLESSPRESSLEDADRDFAIARHLYLRGDYADSIGRYESAIVKYVLNEDAAGECYSILYNSLNYREMKAINRSRVLIRTAHDLAVSIGDSYAVLFTVLCSITLYALIGSPGDPDALRLRARQMVEEVGHPKLTGDYHNNAAQALLLNQNGIEAIPHLDRAYEAYLSYYKNDRAVNVIIVRINRTSALILTGRNEEALREILEIREIVSSRAFDPAISIEVYKILTEIYYRMQDYEKAYLSSIETVRYNKILMEEATKRPRFENRELKQRIEDSFDSIVEKNRELSRKNEALEAVIRNNELIKNIGSKLTSTYEMDEMFEIVCRETIKVTTFNTIIIAMIEGDHIVARNAKFFDLPELDLPIYIPLNSKEHILSYCVRNNVDIKIDRWLEFQTYVPEKSQRGNYHSGYASNESAIYCRLTEDGRAIGVFSIQHSDPNAFSEYDFDYVKTIAAFMSVAVVNSRKNKQVQEKARQLEELSLLDPLTMLDNRRSFNSEVDGLVGKNIPYALIFGDLNHLKVINDTVGHEEGDKYLQAVSEILKRVCAGNKVFRLSGDEFAVLLASSTREYVYGLMQKIKNACGEKRIGKYPLAISLGCAFSGKNKNADRMFANAEARMYLDKHDYYIRYGDMLKKGRTSDTSAVCVSGGDVGRETPS